MAIGPNRKSPNYFGWGYETRNTMSFSSGFMLDMRAVHSYISGS